MSAQIQDSQLADIWDSALTKYRQDTKQDLLHVSLEVDSPKALLEIIDREMMHFKEYRKKGERTRAVVISLLEVAAVLSEMVSQGLATLCPPMKAVSIAIRKLCGAAGRLSAYYDTVIDIFDEMDGLLHRLPVYTKQKMTVEFERILVDTLAQLLVTLGAVIKSLKNRFCLQLLKTLGGRDAKVKEALDRLKKVSSQEAPMLMAHVLANVVETADTQRDNTERMLRKEEDELYKDIHSWLHPPDASTNHNVASGARQQGTGDWFVQGQEFLDWSKNPKSFLWIHGIPGNGKTVLCSSVIDTLQLQAFSVVYFYLDFNDPAKLGFRGVIHALVDQMLLQRPGIPDLLRNLYARYRNGTQQPSLRDLSSVLQCMIQSSEQTYIVIDALDECTGPERRSLLDFLVEMGRWKLDNLHTLVTSRAVQEIEETILRRLTGVVEFDLKLRTNLVNQDIDTYIKNILDCDRALRKWAPDVKVTIAESLLKRAHGMFQWVHCQLDTLRKCISLSDLETALQNLPETLDATYNRILQSIPYDYEKRAHTILQFLCFSATPMTLGELAEVVTIAEDEEGIPRYRPENRLRSPEEVLTICGSLVTVSPEISIRAGRGLYSSDNASHERDRAQRTLRPSHFSVQEFLVSQRILRGRSRSYGISAESAHKNIATTCLAYLLRFDSSDGLETKAIAEEHDGALALYAARYWIHHFRSQDPNIPVVLEELFRTPRSVQFLNWIRLYDPERRSATPQWHRDEETVLSPLYYACLAGLQTTVKSLLDQGADLAAQGGDYGNALQAAACEGHRSVVELLLDRGADKDARGGEYGTAAQAASFRGHEKVLRSLLHRDVDVNADGGTFGCALQAASYGGHARIVRLLLERGADANMVGGEYGTALQAASYKGHEVIVRLLVQKGAIVTIRGGRFGSTLQAALYRGHGALAKLLLQLGAETDLSGEAYVRVLQVAAHKGHKQIVQLMLDRGADPNERGHHGNALQAMFQPTFQPYPYRGINREIVRMLWDSGARLLVKSSAALSNSHLSSADWISGAEKMAASLDRKDCSLIKMERRKSWP